MSDVEKLAEAVKELAAAIALLANKQPSGGMIAEGGLWHSRDSSGVGSGGGAVQDVTARYGEPFA